MNIANTFRHSKVARRIVLLFVSCALLPVTILAVISYFEVSAQLRQQSQKELDQASKRQGMAVYERLELLDSDLEVLSTRMQEQQALRKDPLLQGHFRGLALFSSNGTSRDQWGEALTLPPITSVEKQHLLSGNPLLKFERSQDGTDRVVLVRLAGSDRTGDLILVGEPVPEYLYAPLSLSPDLNLCVLSAG